MLRAMANAQKLHLRLFLEGVEVPVISASVQSQPNAAAACTIQIPANDLALQLRPRTLVHLYFYDFYRGAPASDRAWVAGQNMAVQNRDRDPDLDGIIGPERFESSPEQENEDLENQNYRLLFGGEVVGVNYEKTPMSRSITIQCLDWSMYWDYAFQYQVSGYSLGGGGYRAAFTGASTTLFNSFLEGSGDIVVGLMETPPRAYPKLQGTLLGAITHIIEAIGGVNFGRNSIRGVNDFFSIAELRLKITQMLGANPFDQESERRLMSANGFGSLFRRALSGLGKQVSVRDVLNALQKYIFHEVVPTTSPHFIPALVDPNKPMWEVTAITDNTAYASVVAAAKKVRQRAYDMKARQEASTSPQAARELSARNGGLAVELARLVALCSQAGGIARRLALRSTGGSFMGGLEIHQLFTAKGAANWQRIQEQTRRAQRADAHTNTFFPPETIQGRQVIQLSQEIYDAMDQVLNAQIRRRVVSNNRQPDPPARLITQIYRPDVWMVAPPRCNVIFPELYNSFSYGRSFMDEITRLMLRTHSAFFGSDILFDGFYMAPSRVLGSRTGSKIGKGRTGLEPPDLADAPAWFIRDMMDHELYTGIIPKFERMSDLNLHALRGGSVLLDAGDGGPGVRVGYAQLACNHLFFRYRFATRQLNMQGKFNPFFALGFPALIIDKYRAAEVNDHDAEVNQVVARRIASVMSGEGEGVNIDPNLPADERARQLEAQTFRNDDLMRALTAQPVNTHYLGTPAALSHSVSAESGGTTQVQMRYARSTDEGTEFLGDNHVQPARYTRTRNIEVTTTVAMMRPPEVGPGSRGPRGGEVIAADDVTQEFQRAHPVRRVRGRRGTSAVGEPRYTSDERLPLFIPNGRSGRRRGTRVLVGTPVPTSSVPEVAAITGSVGNSQAGYISTTGTGNTGSDVQLTSETQVFLAWRIKERLGVYRREAVDLPPEDLVFPPWYSESYRSQNIGALYSYFFGTGSIVDPVTVVGPRGQLSAADGGDPSGASSVTNPVPVNTGAAEGVTLPEDEPDAAVDRPSPKILGPSGTSEGMENKATLGSVAEHGSIEDAVTELVEVYSKVRRNKFDVDDFLKSYTWRPIASMVDIFGTANLEIDQDGEVVRGVEGFHSRAFGDFDDLRQLTVNNGQRVAQFLGMTTTDADEADGAAADRALRDTERAARLDTRKEKRRAVFQYLSALMATRGILG